MIKKTTYTEEFKQGAISLVVDQGLTHSEVGRRLGTSVKNISRWVRGARNDTDKVEPQNARNLNDKIIALEKENKQLRMEREILKKAAAFFANESR